MKYKRRLKRFARRLGSGLQQELDETKQIPSHIKSRNFKEAFIQVCDIGKMSFIAILWVLPGGGFISTLVVGFSDKIRPTSFQKDKEKEKNI